MSSFEFECKPTQIPHSTRFQDSKELVLIFHAVARCSRPTGGKPSPLFQHLGNLDLQKWSPFTWRLVKSMVLFATNILAMWSSCSAGQLQVDVLLCIFCCEFVSSLASWRIIKLVLPTGQPLGQKKMDEKTKSEEKNRECETWVAKRD